MMSTYTFDLSLLLAIATVEALDEGQDTETVMANLRGIIKQLAPGLKEDLISNAVRDIVSNAERMNFVNTEELPTINAPYSGTIQ